MSCHRKTARLPESESDSANRLSRSALNLLRKLAGGAAGDGVPGAALAELTARDLVRKGRGRARGRLTVTAPGLSYLRRLDAPRDLRKSAGGAAVEPEAVADGYRQQHLNLAVEVRDSGGERRPVWVNRDESPLRWLARRSDRCGRPLVTLRQLAAGERLRADFEYAGLSPRVTAAWGALGGAGPGGGAYRELDPTEARMNARQRYEAAVRELGPGLADVAVRVCCHHEGLEAVERSLAWPVRSSKVVLGLALDRLVSYYGIG